MYGHRGQLLVALGLILAVTLVFNDFLAGLAASGEYRQAAYLVHLVLLAAFVSYTVHLKYEIYVARRKAGYFDTAWRQASCCAVLIHQSKPVDACGDADLVRTFGLGDCHGTIVRTQTEEYLAPDGSRQYADRYTIPLAGGPDGAEKVAQLLISTTKWKRYLAYCENDYVKMLRILVNMFEMKDPYSHGHSEVVSNLAQELARRMGLPPPEADTIGKAALLHDIGKIVVPADIINKQGSLTIAEYEVVCSHARVGGEILEGIELFRDLAVVVRHHHERFDGHGYPDRLAGAEIPLGSRIITVADAFEAMTAGRSARGKRDVAATLAVIAAEKGRQFDPEIAEVFIGMVTAGRA